MRLWLLGIALLCGTSLQAYAADEFGARFGEEAPVALEDASILELQNIAPAAGDETAPAADSAAIDPQTGALEENPAKDLLKAESETAKPSAEEALKANAEIENTEPSTQEPAASEAAQASQEEAQEPATAEPAAGDEATPEAEEQDPAATEPSPTPDPAEDSASEN